MKYEETKSKIEDKYNSIGSVACPYFMEKIIFNSDGLYHLSYSSRIERSKSEQIMRFNLFKFVPEIIAHSGTIQEYRKTMIASDVKRSRNEREMKIVEYWGLVAIVGAKEMQRVKVILRKIGTGPITFWSVMPDTKKNANSYKLASDTIEE